MLALFMNAQKSPDGISVANKPHAPNAATCN